jgi:hypothetical protein
MNYSTNHPINPSTFQSNCRVQHLRFRLDINQENFSAAPLAHLHWTP